jgi:hypothetical protein
MANSGCDPFEQQERMEYIDRLYRLSGRANGLYTGLLSQRANQLLKQDRAYLKALDEVNALCPTDGETW